MKHLTVPLLLASLYSLSASVVVDPPLTLDTVAGTWQALENANPPTLWRLDINNSGAHLAQVTVGDDNVVVRRCISWQLRDGFIKLQFEAASTKNIPTVVFPGFWLVGKGTANATRGIIDAVLSGNGATPSQSLPQEDSKSKAYKLRFVKGDLARKISAAATLAEQAINVSKGHDRHGAE